MITKRDHSLTLLFLYNVIINILRLQRVIGHYERVAIHSGPYVRTFYQRVKNEDEPSDTDPAKSDLQIRRSICNYIFSNTFFTNYNLIPVDVNDLERNPIDSRNSKIIFQISRGTNPYVRRKFNVIRLSDVTEYVFVCPLENLIDHSIIPFYISKEYNIGATNDSYKSGRFIFGILASGFWETYIKKLIFLAEEAAIPYVESDFNIESHYFHIRKHTGIQPVKNNNIDPLCKLISNSVDDFNHHHLCLAVFSSSRFNNHISNSPVVPNECSKKALSFITTEGVELVAGELYHERMTLCYTTEYMQEENNHFYIYISRAYISNQLLAYYEDPLSGKVYLDHLSTNICIADEINSFDFIED